jgi:hypothetical protein
MGDTLPTDADNTATAGKIAWGTLETCCAAMAQLDLAGITGTNAIDSSAEICGGLLTLHIRLLHIADGS